MEIPVLKPPLGSIEPIVRMAPGFVGREASPIGCCDGHPSGDHPPRGPIERYYSKPADRLPVNSPLRSDPLEAASRYINDIECGVPFFICDVRNPLSVGR